MVIKWLDIEARRRRGKGLASSDGRQREHVSANSLVKAYEEDAQRKRALIERARATNDKLLLIVEALRRLSHDADLMSLLEDEDLGTIPRNLADRFRVDQKGTR
tara:strand:+ start:443 stop:754 length:312 start_codon:yes stop_codon:yes gene_type:complete